MAAERHASTGADDSAVDATVAVLAHGLVNVLSSVKATAATLRDNYDVLSREPETMREGLERMARNADFAVALLEDLTRGIAPEVFGRWDDYFGP